MKNKRSNTQEPPGAEFIIFTQTLTGPRRARRKKSPWTVARREAARRRCKKFKPWKDSTGPTSDKGKKKVSLNATKDGRFSKPVREQRKKLRAKGNSFLDEVVVDRRHGGTDIQFHYAKL
ncbi:hypothetical protein UR09_02890 [Candidatus Nitromaritima sp. SCGC AAA799-A02]|nr:hypothetical protein UR09_02890 [Candidatus Nitromaritima sp. SCGC AAA799-A02]